MNEVVEKSLSVTLHQERVFGLFAERASKSNERLETAEHLDEYNTRR